MIVTFCKLHMTTAYKVVVLGEGRVGKTSISHKWCSGTFDPRQTSTTQAGLQTKTVHTSRGVVDINLWDTAGQEVYHAIAPIYYKGAHAALLVYSVIDEASFDRMVQWRLELVQILGSSVKIIMVANKIDLTSQRVIPSSKGVEFAKSIGCQHFEVSAKTGEGIDMLFRFLTEELVKSSKTDASPVNRGRGRGLQVSQGTEQAVASSSHGGSGCC
jgi:small GTP-binding protein